MITRQDIVRVARSYVGTPFHHLERQPGKAIDCAGVIICVARELEIVPKDFNVPPYTQRPDGKTMVEFCNRYMVPIPREAARAGDVIAMVIAKDPQHLGILADYWHGQGVLSLIHASGAVRPPRVLETRLMYYKWQKFHAAYAFPGVE